MIKTVISDLGKVIIFFDNQIFFEKMAEFCPFTSEEIRRLAFIESNFRESFDAGKITPEEFYAIVVRKLEAEIDYKGFFSIYNNVFSLNPPVLDIMQRLKRNYRMVLLSNTDVMRFGFIKKKFPEIMVFDEYVLSYEVGFLKPHPQMYKNALKKAEAAPGECIFIDDIKENVQSAEELGIRGVQFGTQINLESVLKGMGLSF
jgi:putative hydrolase of the HAD superfamily